jgi:hypothetical protein
MLSKSPYETFLFRAANAGYRSNLPTRGKPRRGRFLILTCEKAQVAESNLVRRGWCLGERNISAGIAGANARADRGRALRGRAGADGGSDGGIETAALERGCSQDATQGGFGKGGISGPAAGGDYDDGGLDRRSLGMGSRGYLNHLLYRQRKSGRK